MEKPTCETCPYWEYVYERLLDTHTSDIIGVCRIRSSEDAEFPERYDCEWCGEHPDFLAFLAKDLVNEK